MRIVLADDQPHIRSALQVLLKHEPEMYVVGEAGDAQGLQAQLRAIRPDTILLGWGLPGLAAMGSLSVLRVDCPNLLIIVLSERPEARQEALAAGADVFVSKTEPPERLLAALHSLNSGKKS